MWRRATLHTCDDGLDQLSKSFRARIGEGLPAANGRGTATTRRRWTSEEDIQLLRALATAVRSEQDFNLVSPALAIVGAVKHANATPADVLEVKSGGGYASILERSGYEPLQLRAALNKIVHADQRTADYYVASLDRAHDLLLYGNNRGGAWFAAVSILDLVKAIRALPDTRVVDGRQTNSDVGDDIRRERMP